MKKNYILASAIASFLVLTFYTLNGNTQVTKPNGPGSYKILKQDKESVRIPFKMHNGKPLMKVEINGEKASLMIDNGVLWEEVWLFGSPLVEKLNLKPDEEATIGGDGEGDPTAAYFSSINLSLKFEDIIFYEQPVIVSPPTAGFNKMFPGADGQLCNTFFKHFIVEFDFIKNEVILHNPDDFKPYKNGCQLDMSLNKSGTYAVPFSFITLDGKEYTNKSDIDFGGIYDFKVALNNNKNIQLPENTEQIIGYGAQGEIISYKGKIKSMTFGKYKFTNPTVVFGDEKTDRINPENLGVIGLPMFMKFNIAFDYFNNKIYIEPNSNFDGTIINTK